MVNASLAYVLTATIFDIFLKIQNKTKKPRHLNAEVFLFNSVWGK